MLDITALKTGNFAHPEPCQGCKFFEEGKTYPVGDRMAQALIQSGWAERVEALPSLSRMTKAKLEDYADSIGLTDIDPNMKKSDMIKTIEAYRG